MRILSFILKVLGLSLLVMILALAIPFLLPYPFNKVHVLMIALVLIMLRTQSGSVVWLSLLFYFLTELYALSPDGVVLFSGTIGMLLLYWFFQSSVTNRSYIAAVALAVLGVLIFRILYIVSLAAVSFLSVHAMPPVGRLLPLFGWEVLMTAFGMSIVYAFAKLRMREFNAALLE